LYIKSCVGSSGEEEGMRITMIGHSTVLIEAAGVRLVTDPYFGTRGHLAYRRPVAPALTREEMPEVDVVLLSHLHWDHVDRRYLRSLPSSTPVLAPAAVGWLARLHGAQRVVGLKPWASTTVGCLKITAVPALHAAVTVGFVVEGGRGTLYFAGDTYRRPFMRRIGSTFRLDLALMPVTTFRIPLTMGERSAVEAARDLRARVVIPIHLGVRPRSPLLRTRQSAEGFARRLASSGVQAEVVVLEPGDTWSMEGRARGTPSPELRAADPAAHRSMEEQPPVEEA
jgi:L-ascorbate metabolism protein UlaG (beta-lactamase superfamily)